MNLSASSTVRTWRRNFDLDRNEGQWPISPQPRRARTILNLIFNSSSTLMVLSLSFPQDLD
jgi:hypothetical protein